MDVFNGRNSAVRADGSHHIRFESYGWRWCRVGGADNTLDRSDLNIAGEEIR